MMGVPASSSFFKTVRQAGIQADWWVVLSWQRKISDHHNPSDVFMWRSFPQRHHFLAHENPLRVVVVVVVDGP